MVLFSPLILLAAASAAASPVERQLGAVGTPLVAERGGGGGGGGHHAPPPRPPPRPHPGKCTNPISITNHGPDVAYTVQLKLGTPAQTLAFIVDTGSPDLWVLSSAVAGSTGTSSPGFFSTRSSSYAVNTTAGAFNNRYAAGEVRGQWASDVVCVGSQCVRQSFGLITNPIGFTLDGTPIAGILGLDFGQPLAPRIITPIWQQLAASWSDKQFGVSLSRGPTDYFAPPFSRLGNAGSTLTLGGTNPALYTGALTYLPLPATTDFWRVPLGGVAVGAATVATSALGAPLWAALDSGSSHITGYPAAVAEVYAAIPGAWRSSAGYAVPCDGVSAGSGAAGAPALGISFILGGVKYALADADAIQYAVPRSTFTSQGVTPPGSANKWCIGAIQPFSPWPPTLPPAFILGAPFLRSWYSAYRLSPPAIGLAKAR